MCSAGMKFYADPLKSLKLFVFCDFNYFITIILVIFYFRMVTGNLHSHLWPVILRTLSQSLTDLWLNKTERNFRYSWQWIVNGMIKYTLFLLGSLYQREVKLFFFRNRTCFVTCSLICEFG